MDFKSLKGMLTHAFDEKYVRSMLSHYEGLYDGFSLENWDTALSKSGKFVEATLKALYDYTGNKVPAGHKFKVDHVIKALEQLDSNHNRSVRITIPRACRFVYDIVSNRGARHDSDYFEPNRMDSNVVIPTVSWILAEMIRLVGFISSVEDDVILTIERITESKHPVFESIDGRTYIDHSDLGPRKTALLLLYKKHPYRITRSDLANQVKLNNRSATTNAIKVALTRVRNSVDENDEGWKLRRKGRLEAERVIGSLYNGQSGS